MWGVSEQRNPVDGAHETKVSIFTFGDNFLSSALTISKTNQEECQ